MDKPLRFYKPKAPLPVAVISTEPAFRKEDGFLIRVGRGVKAGQFTQGSTFGPFPPSELPHKLAQVEAQLRAEGYLPSGESGFAEAFASGVAVRRARAALRAGWRGDRRVVDTLLASLPAAVDDVCAILDALGRIGDPRAIPAIRPYAERKLLSRRRSAVEALRNLGDSPGLEQARQRTLAELPEAVRTNDPEALFAAIQTIDAQRQAWTCDLLYEVDSAPATAAVRRVLAGLTLDRPFVWRYVKSILRRAELRNDFAVWGEISHRVERFAGHGTKAMVKSGYDGQSREVTVLSPQTQNYMRRAAWRHLRRLARYRPELYPAAAAEALIHYTEKDAAAPRGKYGPFATCYLLHQILWGGGSRFRLQKKSLRFQVVSSKHAKPPPSVREESHPELWDAQPKAYLRVLAGATLPEVQEFAYRAITQRHPGLLAGLSLAELTPLLDSPFEPLVTTVLGLLENRPDVDWSVTLKLARHALPAARELGRKLLRRTCDEWLSDPRRTLDLLRIEDPELALAAAAIAVEVLASRPEARRALAPVFLGALRATKEVPPDEDAPFAGDGFEAVARVCREALREELAALLDGPALCAMIRDCGTSSKIVAGELLAHTRSPLDLRTLIGVARHRLAAVRSAAIRLLESARWEDASPLFALLDCEWPDVRATATRLLRGTNDLARALDLVDSNFGDVQRFAIETIRGSKHDPSIVFRLAEHPGTQVRSFAAELAVESLPDGAEALERVRGLCRSALLDVWPRLPLKRRVVELLRSRGSRDVAQAEIALSLLEEFVGTQGRADREDVLDAIVRIKMAQPEARSPVTLPKG